MGKCNHGFRKWVGRTFKKTRGNMLAVIKICLSPRDRIIGQ